VERKDCFNDRRDDKGGHEVITSIVKLGITTQTKEDDFKVE